MKPYYEAGGVTLYLGDNAVVLPKLRETFDLVFTSPPYNLGGASNPNLRRSRPGTTWSGKRWSKSPLSEGYGAHDDDLTWPEYVAWQRRVLDLCWARLTERGAIFYNHKPVLRDKTLRNPLDILRDLTLEGYRELSRSDLRQIITWDRGSGINWGLAHFLPVTEWLIVLAKRDWKLADQRASAATDLWSIPPEQRWTGNTQPGRFPIALPARAIETTGARSLLDPYVGSGTSLLAAQLAGIRAVGIDNDERACERAARRLSQTTLALEPAS